MVKKNQEHFQKLPIINIKLGRRIVRFAHKLLLKIKKGEQLPTLDINLN
jgi:hypothetical protein